MIAEENTETNERDPFKPIEAKGTKKILKYVKRQNLFSSFKDFRIYSSSYQIAFCCNYPSRTLSLSSPVQKSGNHFWISHVLNTQKIIFKEMKRLITLFVQLILYRFVLFFCGFVSIKTSHKFFSRE